MTQAGEKAAEGEAQKGISLPMMLMFVGIIVVLYVFMILPQRKKQKEAQMMVNTLEKGDKVLSVGGIYGTVVEVKQDAVVVKVEDGAKIKFSKQAVQTVIEKKNKAAQPVAAEKPSMFSFLKKKKKADSSEAVVSESDSSDDDSTKVDGKDISE
jgi:preprotein translocase subunit YajC